MQLGLLKNQSMILGETELTLLHHILMQQQTDLLVLVLISEANDLHE